MPSLCRDEWLWGWDPTPGIVSVWAEGDGRAVVWRRIPESGVLVREEERFRSWLLLDRLDDLLHLGPQLGRDGNEACLVSYRELEGTGELRYLVSAADAKILAAAVLEGASRRMGRRAGHLRDLGKDTFLALPPEEQYLVATGRTYFRGLSFDSLQRLQFDLETTGLDPMRDRIFMVAVRAQSGATELLEATCDGDAGEAELIRRLVESGGDPTSSEPQPAADLPFLDRRRALVPRSDGPARPLAAGARRGTTAGRRDRRALRRTRPRADRHSRRGCATTLPPANLPNQLVQWRAILASRPNRETFGEADSCGVRRDPARVRRYAASDVEEVAGLARMLGGAAFACANGAEVAGLADAGRLPESIRCWCRYLRAGMALPPTSPTTNSAQRWHCTVRHGCGTEW
jgi:hypothetical protein